jgi:AcrR family transcriptional regulator
MGAGGAMDATRARLVAAARRLFAKHGYHAVATEELVSAARLTRGALYHHFRDKAALFTAVLEAEQAALGLRLGHAIADLTDPWEIARRGIRALLVECCDPAVRRIVLIDGPSVLGWAAWREIDERHSLGLVRAALELNVAAGNLPPLPLDLLTHLVVGALNEAGLALAESAEPDTLARRYADVFDTVLDALRRTARPGRAAGAPRSRTARVSARAARAR